MGPPPPTGSCGCSLLQGAPWGAGAGDLERPCLRVWSGGCVGRGVSQARRKTGARPTALALPFGTTVCGVDGSSRPRNFGHDSASWARAVVIHVLEDKPLRPSRADGLPSLGAATLSGPHRARQADALRVQGADGLRHHHIRHHRLRRRCLRLRDAVQFRPEPEQYGFCRRPLPAVVPPLHGRLFMLPCGRQHESCRSMLALR